jgi:hypothetical protein
LTDPQDLFRISSRKGVGDEPLGSVRGFPLLDLVRWAATPAGKEAGEYGKFGLPPVQRGSVWRPKQIVDLWDSVFRGLPIGSFYLVRRDEENKLGRELSAGAPVVDMGPGWSLLDGQQRLHALICGLQGPPKPATNASPNAKKEATFGAMRCLWVDLAASADGVPRVHITSNSQPFGYDPATGEKLRSDQLKKARGKEGYTRNQGDKRIRDHELFAGLLSGEIMSGDGRKWPPKPILAENESCVFPLHELLDAWLNPGERMGRKQSVEKFVRDAGAHECSGAIEALDQAFEAFHDAEAALIRVSLPSNNTGKRENKAEQMLRLFDRIGSGGTMLSQEERLYSVYKSYQPHVHDAVEAIYVDCGAVLSPVKICGAVLRIAYARINKRPEDGNHSIDVAALIRHLSENLTEWDKQRICPGKKLADGLQVLIPGPGDLVVHPVSAAFKKVYTELALRQEPAGKSNPTGLPDVMLASLPAHCVEVLVMAELTYPREGQGSSFWQDAIAFVLIWQLLVTEPNGAAAVCFEMMRTDGWSIEKFPFRSLYAGLVSEKRKPVCLKVVAPNDMDTIFQVSTDHRFATWKERFSPRDADKTHRLSDKAFTENNVAVAQRWWGREGALLLRWWQRGYLSELYGGFRPAFGSDEDTPYDIDHLIPRNDWGQHWTSAYTHFPESETGHDPSDYRWTRGELGESTGNKWLLDRSINRKAGDSQLIKKLCEIETLDERMKAAIGEMGESMGGAGRENRGEQWDKTTLTRFQIVIQSRTAQLYREFFETLMLDTWR